MKKLSLKSSGFTLVELLVVIAIIAILTGIITSNFTQAKAKSRDAKRISDIAQLQLALELAFDRCNVYPPADGPSSLSNSTSLDIDSPIDIGNCVKDDNTDYSMRDFMSVIPTENGIPYTYAVSSDRYDYVLKAFLEKDTSAMTDDVDGEPLLGQDCNDTGIIGGYPIPFLSELRYCVQPR
ncbi:MAG TPA: type II secretion system protein [Candidatus Paceibacterota bacterium]